jgi:SpoVK/Ycf46/Vps4 family AAA+-type ATPase
LDYAWKSLSYAAKSNVLWAKELIYEMAQNCSNLSYKYLACKEVESWGSVNDTSEVPKPSTSSTKEQPITDPMIELDNLIGLDKVKEEVRTLKNFVTVQLKRKAEGLATPSVSYHCVFSGSPGTGKTTVARILAGIYKELGILQKGHLVEVQRADLVGEYIGQTAPKTDAKIDEAIDGVLFIDEAYTLAQGGQNDYGSEAVATLLKRMEDDRERLVVILAGYDNEIRQFVNMNPGLQSRFNRYIHFDDYSHQELMEIFISNLIKNQYVIKKDAYQAVYQLIYQQIQNKDEHFGNARFVRNMFEKIIQKQANRLSKIPNPTKDQLSLIMACDIPEINLPPKEVPNKKRYL